MSFLKYLEYYESKIKFEETLELIVEKFNLNYKRLCFFSMI